jgi:VanZ family protein
MRKNSSWTKEIIGYIREASAIIHYFSILGVILSIYDLIYGQDTVASIIIWLVVMLFSSVIAELLKSTLPTLLRIASANQKSGETRN